MKSFVLHIAVLGLGFILPFKNVNAQAVLEKKLSLSVSQQSIEQVIETIRQSEGINFLYSPSAINTDRIVSFRYKNTSLKTILDKIFLPLGIGYKVVDEKILLFLNNNSVTTGKRSISGIVYGNGNIPLEGATVKIKKAKAGTTTDSKGSFSLPAPRGKVVLQISHIGYVTKEQTVTEEPVNIVLAGIPLTTEEVVITALGISKKAGIIGYSSTAVKGELLNQTEKANVLNNLQGRVAGVNVSAVNSGPGGSTRILIRGVSNFSSLTDPLIVINGVPMDNTKRGSAEVAGGSDMGDGLSSINAQDIDNVVILKGSVASALFGSRASNGVIQITTKNAAGAHGLRLELNSGFALNSIIDNTNFQEIYGQGLAGKRPAGAADFMEAGLNSWGEKLDGKPVAGPDGKMYPYSRARDQKKNFYLAAPLISNTLSGVKGWRSGNIRVSASYLNNGSVHPGSDFTRYTGNINLNQDITGKLKLMMMVNYSNEAARLRLNLNDMRGNANFTMNFLPANIDPWILKPGYDPSTGYENSMSPGGDIANPWFVAKKLISNTGRQRIISSFSLRYDLTKKLYIQGRMGLDIAKDDNFFVEPTGTGYNTGGGLKDMSGREITELNVDGMLSYTTRLSRSISLHTILGANIRKFKDEQDGFTGSHWNRPFLYTLDNLDTIRPVYNLQRKQTNSVYSTTDFSYKNFFNLGITGRFDQFSTLPKVNQGIFTYSVSASTVYTNFLKIPGINYGKLRFSYAQTSGEAETYLTSAYYQVYNGTVAGNPMGGLEEVVPPADLTPYRLKEYEIGTELKMLGNRLGVDITYFDRHTENELVKKRLSAASGYLFSYEKSGITTNRGTELMITANIVQQKKIHWSASFNFTQVNNKLVRINTRQSTNPVRKNGEGLYRPSAAPFDNGAFVANVEGLPVAQIMAYGYKYNDEGKMIIGEDGIPVRGDLVAMGSGLPKYYGGLKNNFSYKKISLSFLIDYKFGNKVLSGTDFMSYYYGLNKKTLIGRETGIVADGVQENGSPNTKSVPAQDYYKGLVSNISGISVFNGGFIKLRQLGLSYQFSPAQLQHTFLEEIKISFFVRNVATLLKHTDNFDPEDNFSSLVGNAGLEGGTLPQVRTFGIDCNLKFKK